MNILYIGNTGNSMSNGMDIINNRNLRCLEVIYKKKLYVYELREQEKNKLTSMIDYVYGNIFYLTYADYKEIRDLIIKNNIDVIFIGHSGLGNLSQFLKQHFKQLKIITFFHNIETHFCISLLSASPSIKNRMYKYKVCRNERLAVINSDVLITLNKRDSRLLNSYYHRESTFNLPTSFVNSYDDSRIIKEKHNIKKGNLNMLFVGVNFFANLNGINWFIENVMSVIPNINLTIVGKGMNDVIKGCHNITVKGFVKDLDEYYYNTDIVIIPIFEGGGMKTKTAEALMYGCPIIGTKEGFEGYDIDCNEIGGVFSTQDEAINLIKKYINNRELIEVHGRNSRKYFLEYYTFESSVNTMRKYLANLM